MKELSIEQKARAYDEALEKSKRLYEQGTITESLAYIFPELKESEDEKIKKEIISFIQDAIDEINLKVSGDYDDRDEDDIAHQNWCKRAIAWLENIPYTIDHEKREGFHLGYKAALEKQSETFTKKDVDDAYLKDISDAKNELEKKGEQNTNHKTMIVKFICKKDWHGIGDYYYGKIYNGYPCEKEQEGYDIYDDNHIPTFCNKEFIDEYFNIITEEKQGREKPADKVGTKFKVGDWIVQNNIGIYKIIEVCESWYEVIDNQNNHYSIGFDKEYMCHLWTIQDAKNGDVLCTYECDEPKIVFVLKGAPKKHYALSYYCFYNIMYPHFDDGNKPGCLAPEDSDVKPATKEQRDTLFAEIKEAGYEWYADKKELKKIE